MQKAFELPFYLFLCAVLCFGLVIVDLLDLYCNVIDLDMLSYIFIAEEMDGCILLKPSLTYKGLYFLFSGLNILSTYVKPCKPS